MTANVVIPPCVAHKVVINTTSSSPDDRQRRTTFSSSPFSPSPRTTCPISINTHRYHTLRITTGGVIFPRARVPSCSIANWGGANRGGGGRGNKRRKGKRTNGLPRPGCVGRPISIGRGGGGGPGWLEHEGGAISAATHMYCIVHTYMAWYITWSGHGCTAPGTDTLPGLHCLLCMYGTVI